jgi:hypothetical protein
MVGPVVMGAGISGMHYTGMAVELQHSGGQCILSISDNGIGTACQRNPDTSCWPYPTAVHPLSPLYSPEYRLKSRRLRCLAVGIEQFAKWRLECLTLRKYAALKAVVQLPDVPTPGIMTERGHGFPANARDGLV